MNIEPYDGIEGIIRGFVQSESHPEERHFVDLSQNAGTGFCSCPWFTFHLAPQVFGKKSAHPELRCKHIQAFRAFTGEALLDAYVRDINKKP